MRITDRMMQDTILRNITRSSSRLEELENQLTSGKRISRPSDDPAAIGRVLAYRAGLSAGEQYIRTMDSSLSWLNATDTSLDSMGKLLQRARELAVQGANDTLAPDQQQAIASEVDQILQQMVTLGNSTIRGQRLFAGLKTDANPFTLSAGPPTTVTYGGDTGQMLREIDAGTTIQINTPGSSFLPGVFTALIDLRDNLQNARSNAVSGSDLPALDQAIDSVLTVRSDVGAKINRIESAQDRQQDVQLRLTELLSKTEDVDLTEAISAFSLQQAVYQAALAAGSKAIQPSLLDYLR